MHRSGTSLLARLVNLLGVELGENQLLNNKPVSANPKGHWEHRELSAINDALLDRYGGTWDKPPLFPSGWQNDPALYDLRLRAHTLVNDQFRDYKLWGWKDPRTCLTLPFWQELLGELHNIICLRHPVSVAGSLARRDHFSAEKSFYLWLIYLSSALQYSRGKPRLLVFYQDLIEEKQRSLAMLSEFIGSPERADDGSVRDAAAEFTEPALQHHHHEVESSRTKSQLEQGASSMYSYLRKVQSFDHVSESELAVQLLEIETLVQQFRNRDSWRLLNAWRRWQR